MCTDFRLVRLTDLHISARTLDFALELGSTVEVVPRGQEWRGTVTGTAVAPLAWTNSLGFVGMGAFGFDRFFADGLNEAGLSVGTLWLPETSLPTTAPSSASGPALDFINLAGWLLGTCSTVAEVKAALATVQIWNAPVKDFWPSGQPVPDMLKPLMDWALPEHLAIHDATGADLVVEFIDGQAQIHDNAVGVLTNSPTFPWHVTNLRNYIGLTNVDPKPYNLMGMPVTATGNGTGLMGLPGDVTPPSRFVRATVLTQVASSAANPREAVNQAFHSLDLVSVPRHLAASGDYTQWYVVRDHDSRVYYVRSYDGWTTDVHDLRAMKVDAPGTPVSLPLPAA
jgi:choloylglycine hydrolase